jgi:hypothetical protein
MKEIDDRKLAEMLEALGGAVFLIVGLVLLAKTPRPQTTASVYP